jgi:hypothetical protein
MWMDTKRESLIFNQLRIKALFNQWFITFRCRSDKLTTHGSKDRTVEPLIKGPLAFNRLNTSKYDLKKKQGIPTGRGIEPKQSNKQKTRLGHEKKRWMT